MILLVDHNAQHLITAGGKRFRPLLALLAAQLGDPSGTRPIDAAVSVELIHIGSLYHDDIRIAGPRLPGG